LGATFKESPENALTWALTLTDPRIKPDEIGELLKQWQKKDPAAAKNWLDHAPPDVIQSQKEFNQRLRATIVD
jgi:hypothetical protein